MYVIKFEFFHNIKFNNDGKTNTRFPRYNFKFKKVLTMLLNCHIG